MSTTAQTSEDFRAELNQLMNGIPRLYDQALKYASILENTDDSEEEEEDIPTVPNRKKKPKPEGQKKGAYFAKALTKANLAVKNEVKVVTESLLAYIKELEK